MTGCGSSRLSARRGYKAVAGRKPGGAWDVMQRVDHPDPVAASAQALTDSRMARPGLPWSWPDRPMPMAMVLTPPPQHVRAGARGVVEAGIRIDFDQGPASLPVWGSSPAGAGAVTCGPMPSTSPPVSTRGLRPTLKIFVERVVDRFWCSGARGSTSARFSQIICSRRWTNDLQCRRLRSAGAVVRYRKCCRISACV